MWYNIIFTILVVYVVISPLFYAKAVKFGMNLKENKSEPIFNVPIPKKKPQMTPEQDRAAQIMANMDRYNGTSFGQKKVTVKK